MQMYFTTRLVEKVAFDHEFALEEMKETLGVKAIELFPPGFVIILYVIFLYL